jgi:copper chaperone CopZ
MLAISLPTERGYVIGLALLLIALFCPLPAAADDGGSIYTLRVDGLACPFCAYGIEKELHSVQGVEQVETNIKDGVVIVTMQEGADLDESTARQAVGDAGFTLRGFDRMPSDSQQ